MASPRSSSTCTRTSSATKGKGSTQGAIGREAGKPERQEQLVARPVAHGGDRSRPPPSRADAHNHGGAAVVDVGRDAFELAPGHAGEQGAGLPHERILSLGAHDLDGPVDDLAGETQRDVALDRVVHVGDRRLARRD